MSKAFRRCDLDQTLLMPPCLHDWLPRGHLARFIHDVVEQLDLSAIYASYEDETRGQPGYEPTMLVRLLLYGYCTGTTSSRKIEQASYDAVAFRYLSGDQHPDHDTIAAFRRRHLSALASLFVQALQLCRNAGLVKLGHVAIDGTKLRANASAAKSMRYGQMDEAERQLRKRVEALLMQAERQDADEDRRFGAGQRGDELPAELADTQTRLQKLRAAKAALEQQARERAIAAKQAYDADSQRRREQHEKTGKKPRDRRGPPPDPERAMPDAKQRHNFSDPDSRLLREAGTHFVQGYNTQLAVDDRAQIIVAASVTQEANDCGQLVPLLAQVRTNMERVPLAVSADTGYFSLAAIRRARAQGVRVLIPPHAQPVRRGKRPARISAAVRHMWRELKSKSGRRLYARRKTTVEPVVGQIKEQRQFRRFRLRGLANVACEWTLICLGHNLLKLFRQSWLLQPA